MTESMEQFVIANTLSNSGKIAANTQANSELSADVSALQNSGVDATAREAIAQLILDLASTVAAKGASLVGIEDTGEKILATTVEAAQQELATALDGKVDDAQVLTNVPTGAVFTDTVYTHPTTAGNKHIPTGGAANQVLKYSADGTAVWGTDNDTVYTHPANHAISVITGLQAALDALEAKISIPVETLPENPVEGQIVYLIQTTQGAL